MHGSFENKICATGYVPQLTWNQRAFKRTNFFYDFELHAKLEPFRSNLFGNKNLFYEPVCMGRVLGSTEDEIFTVEFVPQLEWSWRAYNRIWFSNDLELKCKIEPFISSYFGTKNLLYHSQKVSGILLRISCQLV